MPKSELPPPLPQAQPHLPLLMQLGELLLQHARLAAQLLLQLVAPLLRPATRPL